MLYFQQHGSGKTIVFLHGSSQSLNAWDNLLTADALAAYHIITPDLPGHGKSPRSSQPETDYTLKGLAQTLKDFLNNLPQEYVIVASSLATNIASEIITKLPNCKGLMLVSSSIIGEGFEVAAIVQPSPNFATTFTPDPPDEDIVRLIATFCNNMDAELEQKYFKMFKDTDPALRVELGKAITAGDWSDEIANIKQLSYPVAIIGGSDDKIVYPEYLNRSSLNMWRGKAIVIPNAGHCCHLDQPGEFAGLVNEYAAAIFKSSGF